MAWHILEKLIEQVGQHSTLIGKFWTTFFFVLRLVIVISIADDVFEDEQEEFVCNTLTPGCQNVCFNEFSPISLLRLWALQVLGVSIPSVIFIVYTVHKMDKINQSKKLKKKELEKSKRKLEAKRTQRWREMTGSDPPEYNRIKMVEGHVENANDNTDEKKDGKEKENKSKEEKDDPPDVIATKLKDDDPPRLLLAYVGQVIFRLIVEIAFLIAQMRTYVFKFYIPELFKCSRWPCPNTVDCFVSRPKEKTVLLWIMFGSAVVMIILSALELYHIGIGKMHKAWSHRHQDITKEYKVASGKLPQFGRRDGWRYAGGYPQTVGIRVGYARTSISSEGDERYHTMNDII